MSNVTNINDYRNREQPERRAARQELAQLPIPQAEHLAELPGFLDGVLTLVVDHGMAFDDAVDIALAVGLNTWIEKHSAAQEGFDLVNQLNTSLREQLAAAHLQIDQYRAGVPMFQKRKIEVNR